MTEENYISLMLKNKNVNFDKLLFERLKVLEWLIDSYGVHSIPISSAPNITKEFIIENFNVNPSYFEYEK